MVNFKEITTIDVSNLPIGSYMIQYSSDAQTLMGKFIKIN
jgi:hypothetical protein